MNNKVLGCLMAAALSTMLAVASPALARGGGGGGGGGGGHGGGMGGGMHGGGWGGGMHGGGWGGGMRGGGWGGGMHGGGWGGGMRGGPMHFSAMGGGQRFASTRFAGNHFAHAGGFHNHRFFHNRHARFAFIGGSYGYADYDSCWRPTWTPYGRQWVDVCSDYGY